MVKRILVVAMLFAFSWAASGCVSTGKYEKKEQEADTLSRDLQNLQAKNASEIADLKAQLDKLAGDAAKEKEKLTTENTRLEKSFENLLRARSDELGKNLTELRQKIADLESENARLKGDIANLRKAKEEEVQKTSKTYEEMLEKMKSEISQGQVTISELKGKLTVNMVDAILFDSGKAEVKPEGLIVLQKVSDILKTVKDKAIRIEGHTDNKQIVGALTKKFPTNWELSAARAINVTRYLQQQGLDAAVLSAIAYGEFKPVASNDTDEGRAKNRRIEIILVAKEAQ
jgi:chemotaxis protein MotB